jgi:hypothetical protein
MAISLSPKSCSGVEVLKNLSTEVQQKNPQASMDHVKMASRTLSSDVTVISSFCKNYY